jgi:hypothetical protein
MCSLGADYHRGYLYHGDVQLDGSYVDFISMLLASMGIFIEACSCHMAKAARV